MFSSKTPIMVVLSAIGIALIGLFVWAGMQSSLWGELQSIVRLPWGLVTLIDLSVGLIVVALWIAVLERRWWPTAGWIALLLCLGNLATVIYLLNRFRRSDSILGALTPQANRRP